MDSRQTRELEELVEGEVLIDRNMTDDPACEDCIAATDYQKIWALRQLMSIRSDDYYRLVDEAYWAHDAEIRADYERDAAHERQRSDLMDIGGMHA